MMYKIAESRKRNRQDVGEVGIIKMKMEIS